VNAHDDAPTLFQTRWVLSYLRGPLTREQLVQLKTLGLVSGAAPAPAAGQAPPPLAPPAAPAAPASAARARPVVPPGVTEVFRPARGSSADGRLVYRPGLLATARLRYADAKVGVDQWETLSLTVPVPDDLSPEPWQGADAADGTLELEREPLAGADFEPLPRSAGQAKSYAVWAKAAEDHLYRTRSLVLRRSGALKLASKPGESEGDFRVRLSQAAREQRDLALEDLKRRYAAKVQALQDKLRTAEERVRREQSQAGQAKLSGGISMAGAVLGALFGSKKVSVGTIGRAGTAARGMGRASKEAADVARAEEGVEVLRARLSDLEREIASEAARIASESDPSRLVLDEVRIAPKKADITVAGVALAWTPVRLTSDGRAAPAV
jgi:hypothetical protein